MIPNKYHTFVDGQVEAGKITAERLNKNWDNLYDMLDPQKVGISEDNIKNACKIVLSNQNYLGINKITGSWEFASLPTIPDGSIVESKINVINFVVKSGGVIPDSDIAVNIPRKENDETITGTWSFNSVKPTIISVASLPEQVVDGQIIRYNSELYLGANSQWKKLITQDEVEEALVELVVSSTKRNINNGEQHTNSNVYIKLKETTINETILGKVTLSILDKVGVSGGSSTLYFAINDEQVGEIFNGGNPDYTEHKQEDLSISFTSGDKLQLYGKLNSGTTLYVDQLAIYFNKAITEIDGIRIAYPLTLASQSDLSATYDM